MSKDDESNGSKSLSNLSAVNYSSENETSEIISQPRPPRNLQDLLRYSAEAANAIGPAVPDSSFSPLDNERKKFLEEAVKSITVDVVEELLKCIKVLSNASLIPEDSDTTCHEEALDTIFEYVDNVDVANDFHKIGGFCIFKPCLESSHETLRWRGAELVAELCQNNPYCQNKVLEMGLMPQLLRMIDSDTDDNVRIKSLYAVSCIARGSDKGLNEFINSDGFSVLLRALQTDSQKLNTKAAFLLSTICQWKPLVKDDLVNMGYIEQLIEQISIYAQMFDEGHLQSVEHLLNALLGIVNDHQVAIEICRKPELSFKSLLDFIVKNSEETDQYQEENEYAKNLIEIVFGESECADEDR